MKGYNLLAVLAAAAISPACGAPRPAAPPRGTAPVVLHTADGWTVRGDLYRAQPASRRYVILLHQRGGSAMDWAPLALDLQRAGVNVMALDARGTHRSSKGPGRTGDDAPTKTGGDIAAAIASVRGPGVLVALGGASYGANNALIYAAEHPDQVCGVALFSPGAVYFDLPALPASARYWGSLAIFGFSRDPIAGSGPRQILRASPSRSKSLAIVEGSGHGTDLLRTTAKGGAVQFFLKAFAEAGAAR